MLERIVVVVVGLLLVGCPAEDVSDTMGDDGGTRGTTSSGVGSSDTTQAPGETAIGCELGTEGCQCMADDTCNGPLVCNTNLNICTQDLCPIGTEACACTPEGSCDPGLICASDLCVDAGCVPGTEACVCLDEETCDRGLVCLSGLCVMQAGPHHAEGARVAGGGS